MKIELDKYEAVKYINLAPLYVRYDGHTQDAAVHLHSFVFGQLNIATYIDTMTGKRNRRFAFVPFERASHEFHAEEYTNTLDVLVQDLKG